MPVSGQSKIKKLRSVSEKIIIFAVLKWWLLQERQTKLVLIIFPVLLGKIVSNSFQNVV